MSLVEFLFFVLVDVVITLLLRKVLFFRGCSEFRVFILKVFSIVMAAFYATLIGGVGVVYVELDSGDEYLRDLMVVRGGSFVMVLFHAGVSAFR